MHIERLWIERFRNLAPLRWHPHPRFNIIEGDNGQGKTNLIEAIAVLSALRSFRAARLADCITFGEDDAGLGAKVAGGGGRIDLGLRIARGATTAYLDGARHPRASALLGQLKTVTFSAADLQLPAGEPAQRRRWLDRAMFQHDPSSLDDMRRYDAALQQRNAVLRRAVSERGVAAVDAGVLAAFDQLVIGHGARLRARRAAFVETFRQDVAREYRGFGDHRREVDLRYAVHGPDGLAVTEATPDIGQHEAALAAALQRRRALDLRRGVTSVGPHRDDVQLLLDGRPARDHASAGQARSLVISIKVAEIRSLERRHGEPPVLLLDDLSSELDATRNAALMQHIDALGGQVFLTTTAAAFIHLRSERAVLRMDAGALSRCDGLALAPGGDA